MYYEQSYEAYEIEQMLCGEPHDYPCTLTLNFLSLNSAGYGSDDYRYRFLYFSAVEPREYENGYRCAGIDFEIISQSAFLIDEIEGGRIYSYTFGILPGDYCFASPGSSGNVIALTQGLVSPIIGEGYYEEDDMTEERCSYEVVTVHEGDHVQVYGMYIPPFGAYDSEMLDLFIEWARNHNASIEQYALETTPEAEVEEPTESESDLINMDQPQEAAEETVSENQPAEEVVEAAPSQPVEDAGSGFPWAVACIVGVLAVVVAVFAVKKSK